MSTKAYTRTNNLTRLAPLVLFLTSYMPLFILIIVRQTIANSDYLVWGGLNFDAILCLIKHFGISLLCLVLTIFGLIGTYVVFENLQLKVENGYTIKTIDVSSMNDEPLAYIATYVIPLMFEDYSNLPNCLTIIGIFYIVYRLYVRSKLLLVNPILSLKYSIYSFRYMDGDIERQGVLISKDNDILESDCIKVYNIGYQLYYGYKRVLI